MHTYGHIYLCCIDHVVCIYVVYFLEDLISTNKVCTLHALHVCTHITNVIIPQPTCIRATACHSFSFLSRSTLAGHSL